MPSTALLLPAGEVVVEAFDPVLEGLVEALHEVLPSDWVDVVLHPQPSAGLGVPGPFVRPDRLVPAVPSDKLLDEQVGVYRVALMADMEGQEELLDGLVCYSMHI